MGRGRDRNLGRDLLDTVPVKRHRRRGQAGQRPELAMRLINLDKSMLV